MSDRSLESLIEAGHVLMKQGPEQSSGLMWLHKTAALVKPLLQHLEAEIKTVWLVRTPGLAVLEDTAADQLNETMWELSIDGMLNVARGTPDNRWEEENTKLYLSKAAALADARERLRILREKKIG